MEATKVLTAAKKQQQLSMQVFVRVRPLNSKEITGPNAGRRVVRVSSNGQSVLVNPNESAILLPPSSQQQSLRATTTTTSLSQSNVNNMPLSAEKVFEMNGAFSEESSNEQIFTRVMKSDIQNSLFDGFHCTCFVYGMTGAGKTFTMFGDMNSYLTMDSSVPGIILLALREIVKNAGLIKNNQSSQQSPSLLEEIPVTAAATAGDSENPEETSSGAPNVEPSVPAKFEVKASYLEIYNEQIHDLLSESSASDNLMVVEDPTRGVFVPGLTEIRIENELHVTECIRQGNTRRQMASTTQNEFSSRSHAILQFTVEKTIPSTKANGKQVHLTSKLCLVDLAGSERASTTENRGVRLQEGANINKSLLALGNCINILADTSKKGAFVPYRDSKLTRLLKDSLGGNTKTYMIACVSSAAIACEETLNTLKYAARARNITKTVTQNLSASFAPIQESPNKQAAAQYEQIIEGMKQEIDSLKAQLAHTACSSSSYQQQQQQLCLLQNQQQQQQQQFPAFQMTRISSSSKIIEESFFTTPRELHSSELEMQYTLPGENCSSNGNQQQYLQESFSSSGVSVRISCASSNGSVVHFKRSPSQNNLVKHTSELAKQRAEEEIKLISAKILKNLEENWEISQSIEELSILKHGNEATLQEKVDRLRALKKNLIQWPHESEINATSLAIAQLNETMQNNESILQNMSAALKRNLANKEELQQAMITALQSSSEQIVKDISQTCAVLQIEKAGLESANIEMKQQQTQFENEYAMQLDHIKSMEKQIHAMQSQLEEKNKIINSNQQFIQSLYLPNVSRPTQLTSLSSSSSQSSSASLVQGLLQQQFQSSGTAVTQATPSNAFARKIDSFSSKSQQSSDHSSHTPISAGNSTNSSIGSGTNKYTSSSSAAAAATTTTNTTTTGSRLTPHVIVSPWMNSSGFRHVSTNDCTTNPTPSTISSSSTSTSTSSSSNWSSNQLKKKFNIQTLMNSTSSSFASAAGIRSTSSQNTNNSAAVNNNAAAINMNINTTNQSNNVNNINTSTSSTVGVTGANASKLVLEKSGFFDFKGKSISNLAMTKTQPRNHTANPTSPSIREQTNAIAAAAATTALTTTTTTASMNKPSTAGSSSIDKRTNQRHRLNAQQLPFAGAATTAAQTGSSATTSTIKYSHQKTLSTPLTSLTGANATPANSQNALQPANHMRTATTSILSYREKQQQQQMQQLASKASSGGYPSISGVGGYGQSQNRQVPDSKEFLNIFKNQQQQHLNSLQSQAVAPAATAVANTTTTATTKQQELDNYSQLKSQSFYPAAFQTKATSNLITPASTQFPPNGNHLSPPVIPATKSGTAQSTITLQTGNEVALAEEDMNEKQTKNQQLSSCINEIPKPKVIHIASIDQLSSKIDEQQQQQQQQQPTGFVAPLALSMVNTTTTVSAQSIATITSNAVAAENITNDYQQNRGKKFLPSVNPVLTASSFQTNAPPSLMLPNHPAPPPTSTSLAASTSQKQQQQQSFQSSQQTSQHGQTQLFYSSKQQQNSAGTGTGTTTTTASPFTGTRSASSTITSGATNTAGSTIQSVLNSYDPISIYGHSFLQTSSMNQNRLRAGQAPLPIVENSNQQQQIAPFEQKTIVQSSSTSNLSQSSKTKTNPTHPAAGHRKTDSTGAIIQRYQTNFAAVAAAERNQTSQNSAISGNPAAASTAIHSIDLNLPKTNNSVSVSGLMPSSPIPTRVTSPINQRSYQVEPYTFLSSLRAKSSAHETADKGTTFTGATNLASKPQSISPPKRLVSLEPATKTTKDEQQQYSNKLTSN